MKLRCLGLEKNCETITKKMLVAPTDLLSQI